MDRIVLGQEQAYEMLLKDYPDVLLISDLCRVLDISIKTAYRLIKDKQIEAKKVGRSYRILKISVLKYLGVGISVPDNGACNG